MAIKVSKASCSLRLAYCIFMIQYAVQWPAHAHAHAQTAPLPPPSSFSRSYRHVCRVRGNLRPHKPPDCHQHPRLYPLRMAACGRRVALQVRQQSAFSSATKPPPPFPPFPFSASTFPPSPRSPEPASPDPPPPCSSYPFSIFSASSFAPSTTGPTSILSYS